MIYATLLSAIDYPASLILNEEIRRHDPDYRHYFLLDKRCPPFPHCDQNGGFTRVDKGQTDWGKNLDTRELCLEETRWFLKLSKENGGQPVIKIDADVWINDWPRLRRIYADVAAGTATLITGAQPHIASATGPAYVIQPCEDIIKALQSMALDRYPEDKCIFAACAAAGKKALLLSDLFGSCWNVRAEGRALGGVFAHAGEPARPGVNVPREIALERMIYSRAMRDMKKTIDKANSTKFSEDQPKTQS